MTDNIKLFVSREEQGYLIRWGKKKNKTYLWSSFMSNLCFPLLK